MPHRAESNVPHWSGGQASSRVIAWASTPWSRAHRSCSPRRWNFLTADSPDAAKMNGTDGLLAACGAERSMTRRIREQRHGVHAVSSGTGDTGDTLLKQTHSPPSAPPSGRRTRKLPREDPWPPPAGALRFVAGLLEPPRRLPVPAASREPSRPRPDRVRPACRTAGVVTPRARARRFLRRFQFAPQNPRERAGGSNPSPPISQIRTTSSSSARTYVIPLS